MNLLVSWGQGGRRPVLSGRQHVRIVSSDILDSFTNESHERDTVQWASCCVPFSLKAVDKGPLGRNSEQPTHGSSMPQTEQLATSIDSVHVRRSFQFSFYPSIIPAGLDRDNGHSLLSRLTA